MASHQQTSAAKGTVIVQSIHNYLLLFISYYAVLFFSDVSTWRLSLADPFRCARRWFRPVGAVVRVAEKSFREDRIQLLPGLQATQRCWDEGLEDREEGQGQGGEEQEEGGTLQTVQGELLYKL